jgi:hypothetical protein
MAPTTPNWPPAVLRLAKAITIAEGSRAAWNNPGDLTYAFGFPTLGTANRDGVLIFQYPQDGEQALCQECSLMLNGRSHVYKLTDTLQQVGVKYANGDPNWSKNVAMSLGVPESTTLQQIADPTSNHDNVQQASLEA